jgi:hypothetical protein
MFRFAGTGHHRVDRGADQLAGMLGLERLDQVETLIAGDVALRWALSVRDLRRSCGRGSRVREALEAPRLQPSAATRGGSRHDSPIASPGCRTDPCPDRVFLSVRFRSLARSDAVVGPPRRHARRSGALRRSARWTKAAQATAETRAVPLLTPDPSDLAQPPGLAMVWAKATSALHASAAASAAKRR